MNTDCVKHPEPSLNCPWCDSPGDLHENCRLEILKCAKRAAEDDVVEGFTKEDYL